MFFISKSSTSKALQIHYLTISPVNNYKENNYGIMPKSTSSSFKGGKAKEKGKALVIAGLAKPTKMESSTPHGSSTQKTHQTGSSTQQTSQTHK